MRWEWVGLEEEFAFSKREEMDDPVPLVVTLLLFFILCMIMGFLWLKYTTTRQELALCRTFRVMEARAKTIV